MTIYTPAPEVADIAAHLIDDVDELSPLGEAEIRYVYRDKHAKKGGNAVLGKARTVTGLNAMLAKAQRPDRGFFVVEIALDIWRALNHRQRVALVDHELSHCYIEHNDGEVTYKTVGHYVEEHVGTARRHGAWRAELGGIVRAVTSGEVGGQGRLDIDRYPNGGARQPGLELVTDDDEREALRQVADVVNDADVGVTIDKAAL